MTKMKIKFIQFIIPALLLLVIALVLLALPEYIGVGRWAVAYHYDVRTVVRAAARGWRYDALDERLAKEEWGDAEAEKLLEAGYLTSSDKRIKAFAIFSLGFFELDSEKYIPIIIDSFSDKDMISSPAALRSYGDRAYPYLEKSIKSTDPLVRENTCYAFAYMDERKKDAYPLLREIFLADSNKHVRFAAVNVLCRRIKDPAIIPDILSVIRKETDRHTKFVYVSYLASMRLPEAVDAYAELIINKDIDYGRVSIFAGKLTPEEEEKGLVPATHIPLPEYNGKLNEETIQKLRVMQNSEEKLVFKWATEVLAQCKTNNTKRPD